MSACCLADGQHLASNGLLHGICMPARSNMHMITFHHACHLISSSFRPWLLSAAPSASGWETEDAMQYVLMPTLERKNFQLELKELSGTAGSASTDRATADCAYWVAK